jgi:cold shock CspA family protein
MKGIIKFYNTKKGYGFILQEDKGLQDIYFHATNALYEPIVSKDRVTFEIRQSIRKEGSVEAVLVDIIEI